MDFGRIEVMVTYVIKWEKVQIKREFVGKMYMQFSKLLMYVIGNTMKDDLNVNVCK